jgi:predicted small metal-binding protein
MKTMTCRELGGPCELAHRGQSADDVIKAQDQHLKDAEKAGDATHQSARDDMKSRWRHPKRSLGWYQAAKSTFAAKPED